MKPPTVFLGEMTDPEVEAHLREHQTVIVPVGSTEQHGPHAPLLTDVLIPVEVARRVAEATGALVAPSVNYALSYPHAGFTGVVHVRISTFMALIEDLCVSFATVGFRRIVFLNGHYDNTYAIAYACAAATERMPAGVRAFPVNYWDGMTPAESAEFFDPATGLHANRGETSAVLAIDPGPRRHGPGERGVPAVPRGHQPRAGAHRVLLLLAGLGPSRHADRGRGAMRRRRPPSSASATWPSWRRRRSGCWTTSSARSRRCRRADPAARRRGCGFSRQGRRQPNRRPAARAHDPADPELAVELDEVGALSGGDPAAVRDPEHRQRVPARGGDRGGQREPGRDQVAHGDVQREDGAGQRGRPGERHPPAHDLHREAADPRASVAHAGERDGIADEQEPVGRLQPEDQGPEPGVDVDAVGDELDVGRVVEERGHCQARSPVVDAGHRVEQVRRRGPAGPVTVHRLVERSGGMPDRGRHAALAEAGRSARPHPAAPARSSAPAGRPRAARTPPPARRPVPGGRPGRARPSGRRPGRVPRG